MGEESLSKTTAMEWTIRCIGLLMSIIIAVSCFFLKEAWYKISNIEDQVNVLRVSTAHMESSRFATSEWVSAKTVLDNERLALDRRIIRMEESLPMIKESLMEIKQTLKEDRQFLKDDNR